MWVNNGKKQIRIKPDELQTYLDNGWVRGFLKDVKDTLSSAHLGSKWMNNGITSLQVKEKDIQLYIDKGYKFGIAKKKKEGDVNE